MDKQHLIQKWKEENLNFDKTVIKAFLDVPRENFVLPIYAALAYQDTPLPILENQTISQPKTVMIMTQALKLKSGQKILEIGTGSGYQAAIISKIIGEKGHVITLEIRDELFKMAQQNLKNYKNVKVIKGDGSIGYQKQAPYDRIILTATAPHISDELKQQLKKNGIILGPVAKSEFQKMIRLIKNKDGFQEEDLGYFSFVPLIGQDGYKNML